MNHPIEKINVSIENVTVNVTLAGTSMAAASGTVTQEEKADAVRAAIVGRIIEGLRGEQDGQVFVRQAFSFRGEQDGQEFLRQVFGADESECDCETCSGDDGQEPDDGEEFYATSEAAHKVIMAFLNAPSIYEWRTAGAILKATAAAMPDDDVTLMLVGNALSYLEGHNLIQSRNGQIGKLYKAVPAQGTADVNDYDVLEPRIQDALRHPEWKWRSLAGICEAVGGASEANVLSILHLNEELGAVKVRTNRSGVMQYAEA